MPPKVSVITPSARGVKELSNLLRDFKNQTFRDFEHIIVYDGEPPKDVADLMKKNPQVTFTHIKKDLGNMSVAPGTRPRNHGTLIATGEFVVYCDDDDRYKDTYLEVLATGIRPGMVYVTQMSCTEERTSLGDPTYIRMIPEVGLPTFPMICHVGTPCFIVPRVWALEEPWQEEPEHDFRFINRICQKYKPRIRILPGMQVDVDGLVTCGVRDWVSNPPFYRD